MFVPGLSFATGGPSANALTSRADVAMFVGCVARRAAPVPARLRAGLERDGWSQDGLFRVAPARLEALLDVPVPVESWSDFDALFAWDERPAAPGSSDLLPTALGLAVKSFFDEGGAKAYVVRTGDPPPLADPLDPAALSQGKRRLLDWAPGAAPADAAERVPILPGLLGGRGADPADPATWSGVGAVYAVEDAAMLLVPDLIDLVAGSPEPVPPPPDPPGPPELFKPCAPPAPNLDPEPRIARPEYRAPRLDRPGYGSWATALRFVLDLLGRPKGPAHRRDVMLLSAMPLPLLDSGFDGGEEIRPLAILSEPGLAGPGLALLDPDSIGNARLQLAYPWIESAASAPLPEGLQSPEGLLAGLIARTALADGAFRSAAGRACRTPRRLQPDLADSEIGLGIPGAADWLGERLSLIGRRRGVVELRSDATMAADRNWRAGGVSRLMGIVLRAAKRLGQDLVFEPSGPHLWARVRSTLEAFFESLWQRGALDGLTRNDAYQVICDQSSMTAADLDAGRIVCRIGFTASYPIEHITVSLLLLEAAQAPAQQAA